MRRVHRGRVASLFGTYGFVKLDSAAADSSPTHPPNGSGPNQRTILFSAALLPRSMRHTPGIEAHDFDIEVTEDEHGIERCTKLTPLGSIPSTTTSATPLRSRNLRRWRR